MTIEPIRQTTPEHRLALKGAVRRALKLAGGAASVQHATRVGDGDLSRYGSPDHADRHCPIDVATAIVSACRLVGEDPVAVVNGQAGLRARHVALAALVAIFPQARKESLARCCGYASTRAAWSNINGIFRAKSAWWREEWVEQVTAVLREAA